MEEKKYMTRMGDGFRMFMTEKEIRDDIADGIADAVRCGKVPPLNAEDVEKLVEIITLPGNVVGVEFGRQVVSTSDSGCNEFSEVYGIPIHKSAEAMVYEKIIGADSQDLGWGDFSFKPVKAIAYRDAMQAQHAVADCIMPLFYAAMPNLGLYTKPDGPVENWSELLPLGKVKEALAAQEEASEMAAKDIVCVAEYMYKAGVDGINMDTSGASGDGDFLAALKACEEIREKFPDMGVEIGMASEFVIGMHGRLEYKGTRLAGLYPHKQVKICEQAGATIFGAVVNTNSSKSFPWNIARVCTFLKECSNVAEIPVHADVGMGVCGIPVTEVVPSDVASRADKALIEICNLDGL